MTCSPDQAKALLRKLERENPAEALRITTRLARDGNPIPLVEFLWGTLVTDEEFLSDREGFESGRHGRYLILDPWQIQTIKAVFDPTVHDVLVKGNAGCGKGAVSGIAVVAYFVAFDDAKVVITRDTWETAVANAYSEVVKWWKKAQESGAPINAKVGADEIRATEQHFIRCANPGTDEGFSGCHGPHVLFWFDEATAVPDSRWKMAETQATTLLATANPRTTSGQFRKSFSVAQPNRTQKVWASNGYRWLITVGGRDCGNVRARCLLKPVAPIGGIELKGVAYVPGQLIPKDVYDEKCRPIVPGQTTLDTFLSLDAHPDRRFAAIMAHGHFPDSDPEYAIFYRERVDAGQRKWRAFRRLEEIAAGQRGRDPKLWWIKRRRPWAMRALERILPIEAGGLDIGGSSQGDDSVLTLGGSRGVRSQWEIKEQSSTRIVDWLIEVLRSLGIDHHGFPIGMDAVGVGLGVVSVARDEGFNVIECFGSAAADEPKLYGNRRAEMFVTLGDRMNPGGAFPYDLASRKGRSRIFALPDGENIVEEFLAHEKVPGSGAERILVTPKNDRGDGKNAKGNDVRSKIGRSPDRADSIRYMWEALAVGATSMRQWIKAATAVMGEDDPQVENLISNSIDEGGWNPI